MRNTLYNFLVQYAPGVLAFLRRQKRRWKRRRLLGQASRRHPATAASVAADLRKAGVGAGDLLMVHSSLSAMGYVAGGAQAVVDALLEVIGPGGTLVMPAFAHDTYSKYYLDKDPVFDVLASPSRAGSVTEAFRRMPGTVRSLHPTDAVCARGPLADWLVKDHFGQPTPYNADSPYARLAEKGGVILCIGVPLQTSCTNLHTLEDAVDFRFPVYHPHTYVAKVRDASGTLRTMQTRVHDPAYSDKRDPDALVPLFEREGVLRRITVARAGGFLIDAAGLFRTMKKHYFEHGVTMYTPFGDQA